MSSEQRAALVERMAAAITHQYKWGTIGSHRSFAEVALAAVEAEGGWPRPEPVTLEEREALARSFTDGYYSDGANAGERAGVRAGVIAVLTSDVLRSRGITVEGA